MGVLEKYSADPFRKRKQKHVVTERGRPIGNGEANAFARHHSAAADQKERGDTQQPDKVIQPNCRSCERHCCHIWGAHAPRVRSPNKIGRVNGQGRVMAPVQAVVDPEAAKSERERLAFRQARRVL